jgi:outer membrane protein TolC
MKRGLCSCVFLLSLTSTIFGQVKDVGVILPKYGGEQMKKVLVEELNKNFEGYQKKPKIVEVKYSDSGNVREIVSQMNKDPKIGGIFIMTYDFPKGIGNISTDKFITYGMGVIPSSSEQAKNINEIYSSLDISEDCNYLKSLDVQSVAIYIPANADKKLAKNLVAQAEKKGLKATLFHPNDMEGVGTYDAVYLVSLGKEAPQILDRANARAIPTFMMDLNNMYRDKSLMGYDFSKEVAKRARAMSLNYRNFDLGKYDSIIQNSGILERNIYYNMGLAQQIDKYPDYILRNSVKLLNEPQTLKLKLTLADAISIALADNPNIRSSFQDIISNEYEVKVTNAQRLPQVSTDMNYTKLDKNITGGYSGKVQNEVLNTVKLSQLIFSDQANAQVEIQKLTLDSVKSQYRQTVLNYIYNVTSTYLTLLKMSAQLQVERNNYALVEETLRIAKINYEAGASGIQDVYRLQSSLASASSNIATQEANMKQQQTTLNTLLRMPINTEYEYQSFDELKNLFLLNSDILKNYTYKYGKEINKLTKFLAEGALNNSPKLYQLDKNIQIKERENKAYKRERYLPVIEAQGQYYKNNVVKRPWGRGSDVNSPDDYWEVAVGFSLPLIKGGETINSIEMTKSQIKSLEYQKTGLEDNILQTVDQQLTAVMSDYVLTSTTKISAKAAVENLKIVKNLYDQGNAAIVDFLDAQNAALSAELQAIIAEYNLLIDNAALENTYGDYIIMKTPEQRKMIFTKIKSLLN